MIEIASLTNALIIGGFTLNFVIMGILFKHMNSRFEKMDEKMDKRFEGVYNELKDISNEVKDIDRRLCRIEGSMASKDCCILKDSNEKRGVQ